MSPPNLLSLHTTRSTVHFTASPYRLTFSLRLILIYTHVLRNHTRTHTVSSPTFFLSSNFLHTMLLFPFTSLPVVGYNLLLHSPMYTIYLRNLLRHMLDVDVKSRYLRRSQSEYKDTCRHKQNTIIYLLEEAERDMHTKTFKVEHVYKVTRVDKRSC